MFLIIKSTETIPIIFLYSFPWSAMEEHSLSVLDVAAL